MLTFKNDFNSYNHINRLINDVFFRERKEIQINFSDGTSCIVVVDGKTYAAVQNENPQTITALKDMYGQLLLKGNGK